MPVILSAAKNPHVADEDSWGECGFFAALRMTADRVCSDPKMFLDGIRYTRATI